MSWSEELRDAVKTYDRLCFELSSIACFKDYLSSLKPEVVNTFPIFIPLKILNEIKKLGPNSSLSKQFLPQNEEVDLLSGDYDPIGDLDGQVAPQLIHRYKNRVLFLPTSKCPINCRYCFRKNEIHSKDSLFDRDYEKTLNYLQEHKEIDEIIFSGGDPLMLTDLTLERYLKDFSKISHIKFIRFHTRFPISLPSRVDNQMLKKLKAITSQKIVFMLHINHHEELNNENSEVIKLITSNFQVFSQSVLLKNINDNADVLKKLYAQLALLGVVPYYLHHTDKVKGGKHFELSTKESSNIFSSLKGNSAGWLTPRLMIDNGFDEGKKFLTSKEYAQH